MTNKPIAGQKASYRCTQGYFYGCSIQTINSDGTVDVEVDAPTAPLMLTKRTWWSHDDVRACPRRAVMKDGIRGAIA